MTIKDHTVDAALGKIIKHMRFQFGLQQRELAEKAEIPIRTLARFEAGQSSIHYNALMRIAKVFGTTGYQMMKAAGLED